MVCLKLLLPSQLFVPFSLAFFRIIGGQETSVREYTFMISLQSYGSPYCGGSLIATNIVLTAAHCLPIANDDDVRIFDRVHRLLILSMDLPVHTSFIAVFLVS